MLLLLTTPPPLRLPMLLLQQQAVCQKDQQLQQQQLVVVWTSCLCQPKGNSNTQLAVMVWALRQSASDSSATAPPMLPVPAWTVRHCHQASLV